MKYNWPKINEAFRAEVVKHVEFYSEDPNDSDLQVVDKDWKDHFAYYMRSTDTFHPFNSDGDLCRALERMPTRCNYRSIKSYWDFKEGKERILDALFDMCQEVDDLIRDYYSDRWNFEPGLKLPCEIETTIWDNVVPMMMPKIMKAAKM